MVLREDRSDIFEHFAELIIATDKEASDYQDFVKKELDSLSEDEKKDMGKAMKDIGKKWQSEKKSSKTAAELNEYQQFVSDEVGDEIKEKDDLQKLPDLMKDVGEKWQDEKKSSDVSIEQKIAEGLQLNIREAMTARQTGVFKRASVDLYQNIKTNDFWKLDKQSGKVIRLVGDNEIVKGDN